MAIAMLKIRRPLGRLIFNMGIAIPGKTIFLIETAPWQGIWMEMKSTYTMGQPSPATSGLLNRDIWAIKPPARVKIIRECLDVIVLIVL